MFPYVSFSIQVNSHLKCLWHDFPTFWHFYWFYGKKACYFHFWSCFLHFVRIDVVIANFLRQISPSWFSDGSGPWRHGMNPISSSLKFYYWGLWLKCNRSRMSDVSSERNDSESENFERSGSEAFLEVEIVR